MGKALISYRARMKRLAGALDRCRKEAEKIKADHFEGEPSEVPAKLSEMRVWLIKATNRAIELVDE